ncbi:hypothetical protein DAEQUDRAFT_635569, partial [Daedalea quercina L-15889]
LLRGLVQQQRPRRRTLATARLRAQKDPAALSTEEVLQRLEVIKHMEKQLPYDPWGQPVQTFDVVIPGLLAKKRGATLAEHLRAAGATLRNWVRNVASMRIMAGDKGFPGIPHTSTLSAVTSLQIFRAQSTKASAWVAPIRRAALDTYTRLNEAVAARDEDAVKALAIGDMRAHYLGLVRRQDPARRYVWRCVGERTPCRILSVRSTPAHLGMHVPNDGSRLLTQVLVRFDTLQSLEVYSKKGTLVHKQDAKPVVEHLVLQKRMWYDSPWVVRDVLYEGLENHEKVVAA